MTVNNSGKDNHYGNFESFGKEFYNKDEFLYLVSFTNKPNREVIEFHICLLKGTKDCPPLMPDVTFNVLCVADYILILCHSGIDGVNGYGIVIEEIYSMKDNGYNPNVRVLGVYINAVDKRYVLDHYYASLWTDDLKTISSSPRY